MNHKLMAPLAFVFILFIQALLHYSFAHTFSSSEARPLTASWLVYSTGLSFYQNFFDYAAPACSFTGSLLFYSIGPFFESLRFGAWLSQAVAALFVFLLAYKEWGFRAAATSSLLFVLFSPLLGGLYFTQESLSNALLVPAFFFACEAVRKRHWEYGVFSGVFFSLASEASYYSFMSIISFMIWSYLYVKPFRSFVFKMLSAFSGFLVTLFAGMLVMGISTSYVLNSLSYSVAVLSFQPPSVLNLFLLLALAALSLWPMKMWRFLPLSHRMVYFLLALWALPFMLLGFFGVSMLLSLAPLCLMAGHALSWPRKVVETHSEHTRLSRSWVALVCLLVLVLFISWALFWVNSGDSSLPVREASGFVSSQTRSAERIFVFSDSPEIYFFSKRLPATKYFFYEHTWLSPSVISETVLELERYPPPVIVFDNAFENNARTYFLSQMLDYSLSKTFNSTGGVYEVYKKK